MFRPRLMADVLAAALIGGIVWLAIRYRPSDQDNVVAAVLIAVLATVAVLVLRRYLIEQMARQEEKARGFEVKPITGKPPVLEERDRNNG